MSSTNGPSIRWLGHATFLLTAESGETLLIDPFVQSNPSCPPAQQAFERLDTIALTHGHDDHIADLGTLCAAHDPTVVAMVELAAWLGPRGVNADRVIAMNKGGRVAVDGFTITMVNAFHSNSVSTDDGPVYAGEAAGLVIEVEGGPCVYHAGDTCVFGDMALIGELYRPDVALLPIGDHFTMGPREAAKACALIGAPRVVPMHYGTWPVLTGTPDALADACAALGVSPEIVVPEVGSEFA